MYWCLLIGVAIILTMFWLYLETFLHCVANSSIVMIVCLLVGCLVFNYCCESC
jgi:hypothetical protein